MLSQPARRFLLEHLPDRLRMLLGGEAQADVRARKLLQAHLTPAQRESLDQRGYFVERGNTTGDEYQIWVGITFNVVRVRDGVRFCFLPRLDGIRLPLADIMLGQALMLRHDEDGVLRITSSRGRTLARRPPGA